MNKANLSIFASGVGSNLLAIHKASMDESFPGKLKLVICNKICPAFKLAKSLNYETKLISSKDNELHLLICVSLLSSFSNYVLISLVEVPLMRYTIYTEVIQIVILLTFFYNALFVEKRN